MYGHGDLTARFFGSPADKSCVRVDYQPKGFDIVVFRGSAEPAVQTFMEPHSKGHARGLETYQREIGFRRRGAGH